MKIDKMLLLALAAFLTLVSTAQSQNRHLRGDANREYIVETRTDNTGLNVSCVGNLQTRCTNGTSWTTVDDPVPLSCVYTEPGVEYRVDDGTERGRGRARYQYQCSPTASGTPMNAVTSVQRVFLDGNTDKCNQPTLTASHQCEYYCLAQDEEGDPRRC